MRGDEKRAEGGDRGQRRLDQMIVGGSSDEHRYEPDNKSDEKAAAGDDDKCARDREWTARLRRIVGRPCEDQCEQNRGRPIVDETLGFNQEPQPAGHAGLAQKRDHRNGVGRGDQRAEDERDSTGQPSQ